MSSSLFLSKDDVIALTGRKVKKLQIEMLKRMALPFWVNAIGHPMVPLSAINGPAKQPEPAPKKRWVHNDTPTEVRPSKSPKTKN